MNHYSVRFLFVIVFSLLAIGAIRHFQKLNPYREILKNDYYAYVLPDDLLNEMGWRLKSIEGNWDAHCIGGPSAPWNPLLIIFQDQENEEQFSLNISDRYVVWDRQRPTQEINLEFPWAQGRKGLIYDAEDFSPIKFVDVFGNEIVVGGWGSIIEKVNLINQLEYVGPSIEDFINPWSAEWCSEH